MPLEFKYHYSIIQCRIILKAIDGISELCGEPETNCLDESDTQRFSPSITFLREWRYFNYEPRTVRFANETGIGGEKVILSEINLPQFSSATVPKNEGSYSDATSLESGGSNCSKDFVMYAGGSVWALDWCPRVRERPDCHTKCEFIAVSAHPPESYYHQLGASLTGRGIIQIWCILNVSLNEEEASPPEKNPKKRGPKAGDAIEDKLKRPRGRPRKNSINKSLDSEAAMDKSIQLKRPRGRPRKKPRDESSDNLDVNDQFVQPLAVQHSDESSELLSIQEVYGNTEQHNLHKIIVNKQKHSAERESSMHSSLKTPVKSRRLTSKGNAGKNNDDICQPLSASDSSRQDSLPCNNESGKDSMDISLASCSTPKNIALPRVILFFALLTMEKWHGM
ncbi:hypothetical protein Patl1_30047 [Pistacia atlantica]|uniref:Uncharacterized protein n=1 Tax=Pistacia atlantica TaxID=434234 RepID=A0ACC1AA76_9ROSI|nr:hypothetical protein Patl1_30047 [Pistacia atlantica]